MDASNKLNLKLSGFQSNISKSFLQLRENEEFCDVTLACDDDQYIEAHKVILSACSTFFKNVLSKTKHSHPFIFLRGISRQDLLQMIDFIYNGEVYIFQEDLQRFL